MEQNGVNGMRDAFGGLRRVARGIVRHARVVAVGLAVLGLAGEAGETDNAH